MYEILRRRVNSFEQIHETRRAWSPVPTFAYQMTRLLALAVALAALAACRPEYRFAPNPVSLVRSSDTVFLDTVFATVGSSTRSVRLVNPSNYDVNLSRVRLGRGDESPFRFNANGRPGPDLEDVVIPAGDSIWVFVETTAPRGDGEMLWEDSLRIEQGSFSQNIYLVALAWDDQAAREEKNKKKVEIIFFKGGVLSS